VHGTNYLTVENNVTYNTVGHCFFLEDGIEHGNDFVRNLAIQTKCHTSRPCEPTNLSAAGEATEERQATGPRGQQSPNVLLPSDNTVSSYWITNPDNSYVDNVAAGSEANGFWLSLPEHPNGQFEGTEISQNTWPRRTPFREFRGNVAHSNYDGFMFDRNINPDNTFGVTGSSHTSREDPADPNSRPVESVFENLTTYKNRNGGIWGRGELHLFRNVKFADNAMGFTHAAGGGQNEYTSRVVDSLFVGETENVGNPGTPEEIAYGRTFPKPTMPDFPIRGYEYYDYRHDVVNTTFRNYEDNATRKTGAISHLLYTSFGASSNNAVENVKFENAKPVYYPPMERRWGNDNASGSLAYKTAVFRDRDGSLGLGTSSFVVIHDGVNDSIAVDEEACEIKPDWNAALCTGDVGRISFVNGGGLAFGVIGAGGFGIDESLPPVILSRDGYEISIPVGTNVRAGTEFKATTERTTMDLHMIEMDEGAWVTIEIPGFTNAASGTSVGSLDALRNADVTSYYKSSDALWVKLVSPGDSGRGGHSGGVAVQVSR
jgi:cell migration-inducing and hyaluronan-binding protein